MRYFILACSIVFGMISFGQNSALRKYDSILAVIANHYVHQTVGTEFAKKNLKFDSILHSGGINVALYETKSKGNFDGRNILLIYFQYEEKRMIDTERSILDTTEILKSVKGETSNLLINLVKAREIAQNSGLKDGLQPWAIVLTNLKPQEIPSWYFGATYESNAYGGSGENVIVHMTDGEYEKSPWRLMR